MGLGLGNIVVVITGRGSVMGSGLEVRLMGVRKGRGLREWRSGREMAGLVGGVMGGAWTTPLTCSSLLTSVPGEELVLLGVGVWAWIVDGCKPKDWREGPWLGSIASGQSSPLCVQIS